MINMILKENYNYELLITASKNGDFNEINRLLEIVDPKLHNSDALRWAVTYGQTEVVKLLLPVSDPKANNSQALFWAAAKGFTDIVLLLIPVSDPKICKSSTLRAAVRNTHLECIKLLLPVSDYNSVLTEIVSPIEIALLLKCIDEYEIAQQKERLQKSLTDVSDYKTSNKRKV